MRISTLIKSSLLLFLSSFIMFVPEEAPIQSHPSSIGQYASVPEPSQAITARVFQPKQTLASIYVAPKVEAAPAAPSAAYPTSDNADKAFIYQHESGNRTTAVNSIGCRGLGQACPGSKLPCGDDYACQDAFFTKYAMERYGSWSKARAFWEANRWW